MFFVRDWVVFEEIRKEENYIVVILVYLGDLGDFVLVNRKFLFRKGV